VEVVPHQAVSLSLPVRFPGHFRQGFDKILAIRIDVEDVLAPGSNGEWLPNTQF
jgi:hypothetical protein